MHTVDIINDRCYFLMEIILTKANPPSHHSVYGQTMSHDSANDVKFIRQNKSPEGKIVQSVAFEVYKSPLLISEARTIDRTRLIALLKRRNGENSWKC